MKRLRSYLVCIGRRQENTGRTIRNKATDNWLTRPSPIPFFVEYFDYGESQAFDTGFDVEEFLRESEQRDRERLADELERIDDLLDERERIHEDAVSELESKLEWYIERLEDLNRRGIDRDQDELKQRIEEFYRDIREHERKQWLDRQELERERREVERELEQADLDEVLEAFNG